MSKTIISILFGSCWASSWWAWAVFPALRVPPATNSFLVVPIIFTIVGVFWIAMETINNWE